MLSSRTHNMEQIFYLTGLSKRKGVAVRRRIWRASVNNCEIDFLADIIYNILATPN